MELILFGGLIVAKDFIRDFIKKQKPNYWKYLSWLLLFIIGFYLIYDEFIGIDFTKVITSFREESLLYLLFFFVCGLISVSVTTIYDFVLCHDFHLKVHPSEIFKISWIGHMAISFAKDQSHRRGGMDYILYKNKGIEPKTASFVSLIKDLFIIGDESVLPRSLKLERVTRFKLILAFLIKWSAANLFFYTLLIRYVGNIPFIQASLIFIIAMVCAHLTFIRSGIIMFELIAMYLFTLVGISLESIILPLFLFRLFYSIVPWILTMLILSQTSILKKSHILSSEQLHLINSMSILSLSALIFFSGLLLVVTASFPYTATQHLSVFIVALARVGALGIGLLLIILSKGIWDKVLTAYYITSILLFVGAFSALFVGFSLEVAPILIIIALALKQSKALFYRSSTELNIKVFITSCFYLTLLGVIYFVGAKILTGYSFKLFTEASLLIDSLCISLFVLFLIIGAILLSILSTKHVAFEPTSEEDLTRLRTFLERYKGNSMTHLIFLKDKSLFFCQDEQVVIAFRPYKDKLIVLGDPIGDESLFKSAINDFRLYADQYDMTPIFYEINEDYLPAYHENGFKFLKLGEEALMDLSEFTLVGKKYAQLRTIKNKMNRGEFTFELLSTPLNPEVMVQLKIISDAWLEGRKEKEFSLGSFNEDYINLAPVAIIKQNETIIGFATIMPMYDEDFVSIDLMRLIPNPPNGAMDALFVGIIEWAIEQGYKHFVLGKAPLSNVGYAQFSSKKEKLVKYIYQYGNKIYSFKGLRRYKEKYHPKWKGIYLAYPNSIKLSISILQLTKMISGSEESTK